MNDESYFEILNKSYILVDRLTMIIVDQNKKIFELETKIAESLEIESQK